MKNIKLHLLSLCLFSNLFQASLSAKVGCMEKSRHTDTSEGYDTKTLHYVACSCPCEKQRHLYRRGKCFKCRHYVQLDEAVNNMDFLYEEEPSLFAGMRPARYF